MGTIKPIGKRARNAHVDCTMAAQALDEEYYPNTPPGSRANPNWKVHDEYTGAAQIPDREY